MSKLTYFALTFTLAFSMPLMAGDKPEMKAADAASMSMDGNVFFTDANGKHAIDPICGMQVSVDEKTASADHDGKHYYFCNASCSKAFSDNPSEAIGKMVLPAGVTAMSGNKMMAACAVSGERVTVNDKTPHQVHNGMDYYFCCNKCPKSFAKNPDKYAMAMNDMMKKQAEMNMKGEMKHEDHDGHEGHGGH